MNQPCHTPAPDRQLALQMVVDPAGLLAALETGRAGDAARPSVERPDIERPDIERLALARTRMLLGQQAPEAVLAEIVDIELDGDWAIRLATVRATACAFLGRHAEGIQILDPWRDAIATMPPDVAGPYANVRMRVLLAEGRLGDALRCCYEGIEAVDGAEPALMIPLLNNMACEHDAAGSSAMALDLFRRALDFVVADGRTHHALPLVANISSTMIADGQAAEAVDYLQRSIERFAPTGTEPGYAFACNMLAEALLGCGRVDAAQALLEPTDGNGVDPDARIARDLLEVQLLVARGRRTEAAERLETMLEVTSGLRARSEMLGQLAALYAEQGRPDRAYVLEHERYGLLVAQQRRAAEFLTVDAAARIEQAALRVEREAERRLRWDVERLNSELAARVAEVERLNAAVREESLRDPLTGMQNRRALMEFAPATLAMARRRGDNCTVAIVDLDHFKAVNDRHGHAAGDEVLRAFAAWVATTVRTADIAVRYGGEEFCLVLDSTPVAGARVLLERLLDGWRRRVIRVLDGEVSGLTFSAGLASVDEFAAAAPLDDLLNTADRRLYAAKRRGRACVVGPEESSTP